MTNALLIAGPPTSQQLWDDVVVRLSTSLHCHRIDLLERGRAPGFAAAVDHVAESLAAAGPRPLLVAHGLAVPVALHAGVRVAGARLVLSNGPVGRLDPVTAGLARLARHPRLLAATLLQPPVLLRWLYSSAGLRRAVRNPYVMDRDTVVAVCGPLFASREAREAVARFVADLPEAVRSTPAFAGPTLLCWGDEDLAYPPSDLDQARLLLSAATHVAVPGGRSLHPVERPWEIADAITAWSRTT